ncbi:hypothetical protein [Frisingicoccus sp.]|uniref:hypothetical protein n=1 Tax=Frisingicoccus sp. TaxID=1918627 RepID=UPI003AB28819
MEIMNQMIVVAQSVAIPLLAVIMAIIVFNMMKKPGKTTAVKEDSFKVTESSFWLVIALFGVASGAIFLWLASTNVTEGRVVTAIVLAGVCFAASIIACYVYFKRSLTVEGDMLTYQPLKGKAESWPAKSVGRIDIVESPRCEEMRFYNRSGKKLFEIQGYMVNSQILRKYMRRYPVKISKVDYDKNNAKR